MLKKILIVLLIIAVLAVVWKLVKLGVSILGTLAVVVLAVWLIKNIFWGKPK